MRPAATSIRTWTGPNWVSTTGPSTVVAPGVAAPPDGAVGAGDVADAGASADCGPVLARGAADGVVPRSTTAIPPSRLGSGSSGVLKLSNKARATVVMS